MSANWSNLDAAHLLGRATFGALPEDVAAAVRLGREETVERLLAGKSLTGEPRVLQAIGDVTADGKKLDADKIGDQQTYWLYRMAVSEAQLAEKMTLFWHGHFAVSYQKVREIPLMARQNELFREHALGSFHDLVLEIGKDPAMMVWLDTNSNRKGKPNENYAREVMELFTLGIGSYTEEDIKEAARAFTGWNVKKDTGEVTFVKNQHDQAIKTVLGDRGNFDEADIVEILFKQKALPVFMARKLLQFFGAPEPSDAWVAEVAASFERSSTVGAALKELFLSEAFYARENRLSLIKTPAEYVAGIMRSLQLPLSNSYAAAMRKMGQELYLPPDVAGWRGGASWLMTTSLLARYQFAESVAKRVKGPLLTSAAFTPGEEKTAADWVALWGRNVGLQTLGDVTSKALAQYADDTFVHAVQQNNGMRGLLHLLLISPEAQMK